MMRKQKSAIKQVLPASGHCPGAVPRGGVLSLPEGCTAPAENDEVSTGGAGGGAEFAGGFGGAATSSLTFDDVTANTKHASSVTGTVGAYGGAGGNGAFGGAGGRSGRRLWHLQRAMSGHPPSRDLRETMVIWTGITQRGREVMNASVRKAATLRRSAAPRNNDRRVLGPHPRRRFLRLAAGTAVLPAVSRVAWAQAYPSRPITMIVSAAAGGGTDVIGRLVAQRMRGSLASAEQTGASVPAALPVRGPMVTRLTSVFWGTMC
jgi:hypothetical protein